MPDLIKEIDSFNWNLNESTNLVKPKIDYLKFWEKTANKNPLMDLIYKDIDNAKNAIHKFIEARFIDLGIPLDKKEDELIGYSEFEHDTFTFNKLSVYTCKFKGKNVWICNIDNDNLK